MSLARSTSNTVFIRSRLRVCERAALKSSRWRDGTMFGRMMTDVFAQVPGFVRQCDERRMKTLVNEESHRSGTLSTYEAPFS